MTTMGSASNEGHIGAMWKLYLIRYAAPNLNRTAEKSTLQCMLHWISIQFRIFLKVSALICDGLGSSNLRDDLSLISTQGRCCSQLTSGWNLQGPVEGHLPDFPTTRNQAEPCVQCKTLLCISLPSKNVVLEWLGNVCPVDRPEQSHLNMELNRGRMKHMCWNKCLVSLAVHVVLCYKRDEHVRNTFITLHTYGIAAQIYS